MDKKLRTFLIILISSFSLLYTSCVFVAGAAAGGAGAYMMKEKGYDIQSPITKN